MRLPTGLTIKVYNRGRESWTKHWIGVKALTPTAVVVGRSTGAVPISLLTGESDDGDMALFPKDGQWNPDSVEFLKLGFRGSKAQSFQLRDFPTDTILVADG